MADDPKPASTPAASNPPSAPGAEETRILFGPDTTRDPPAAAAPATPSASWVGRQIGRYEIRSLIGSGAMGVVYLAHDTMIDRLVAIKVLPETAANTATRDRFFAEAKAVGKVNHPHVVQIYEVGELEGVPYLVLEYVEGGSIDSWITKQGPLTVLQATQAVADATDGLAAAHSVDMLHRDIKPANLLVAADGKVKLTDFGLAKLTSTASAAATRAGQVIGTPYFMSPEQCEGLPADKRSDIYSMGATYYTLLTGKHPYEDAGSIVRVLYEHCHGPVLDPREVRQDVPEACARIIERATAKRPEDRYQSADQMLGDLLAVCASLSGSGIVLPSQSGVRQIAKSSSRALAAGSQVASPATAGSSRRKWLLGVGAIAGIFLAGGIGMIVGFGGKGGDNPAEGKSGDSKSSAAPVAGAPSGPPIKVGVLHSLSGTMAQSGAPVVDAILLAVDEINAAGGVMGRPIEAIVRDGASDDEVYAREAERLLTEDGVCTIFGCWTSSSRKTIAPIVERHNNLLVYSVQYEGLEDSPNVIYTGATPNQQIVPAVRWLFAFDKRRKFYLVGSDYAFPRSANAIIRDAISELGGEVVGEAYRPLGSTDFAGIVKDIAQTKPDVILNTINGDSNTAFFRELRKAGITPEKIPTISFSIGESELRNLNVKQMVGDLAAWNYFQSVDTPENKAFLDHFHARYGPQRVVNDPMESSYSAVKLWAQAVEAAGSTEPEKIHAAAAGQKLTAPQGPVRIEPDNFHTDKTPRIGRIKPDGQFELVWTDLKPEIPEPFPATRSKEAWQDFLKQLYINWGNHWSAPVE